MNIYSWLQLILYMVVLLLLAKPLGSFMASVYQGDRIFLDPVLGPVERLIYRASGVRADEAADALELPATAANMDWKVYAFAMLLFNVLGLLVVYLLQRVQVALSLQFQPRVRWPWNALAWRSWVSARLEARSAMFAIPLRQRYPLRPILRRQPQKPCRLWG